MSQPLVFRRDSDARARLHRWWSSLEHDRASRALLRRCRLPEEVVFVPAFHDLLASLSDERDDLPRHRLAAVAGLASHLRRDLAPPRGRGLGAQLGQPRTKGGPPRMSVIRFRRILEAPDTDELFSLLRRALPLLDGGASLTALADLVLGWSSPLTRQYLAYDYYGTTPSAQPGS